MKKVLMMVIILVLGLSVQSKAQEYLIELDPHGNSIVYFCTTKAGFGETHTLLKLNAKGTEVWRSENQGSCDMEFHIRLDPKDDILISIFDYSTDEYTLRKFSTSNGTRLWTIPGWYANDWWVSDSAVSLWFDSAANIYVGSNPWDGSDLPFVKKYSAKTGALMWTWNWN